MESVGCRPAELSFLTCGDLCRPGTLVSLLRAKHPSLNHDLSCLYFLIQGDFQLVSTDKLLWADAIDFYFNKTYTVHEPTRFRDFLKNGITFTVVGVKHSYVLEDPKLTGDDAVAGNGKLWCCNLSIHIRFVIYSTALMHFRT